MTKLAADVDELVEQHVRPGMHLHFAATMARPNALIYAIARAFRGRGRLTVSTASIHSSAHALALSGAVERVITGFVGDVYPSPRANPLYRDLAAGVPFAAEMVSLLSYTQRLMAAALGQPFAVTASLAGSDLVHGSPADLWTVPDPSGRGDEITLLRPLRPDLTLVHGVCADRRGNVVLCPPIGEGSWSSYAAREGVLASVERIVTDEEMAGLADRVVIPAQRVVGLCEAPLGAHPQSLRTNNIGGVPDYPDDYEFMAEVARRCADPGEAARWFAEWVDLPGGHREYVDRLRARPARPVVAITVPDEPTDHERLIVLAARAIADQVRSGRYDTLMAGIGASHLATWLASTLLREEGHEVTVLAELGFVGMRPEPGDMFLFSQRHIRNTEQLSGIPEVLGGMVAANDRCLGVLAAAEIDERGDINTSKLANGRWLTGSGGANDIASTTDCIVVCTASPRRYVPKVAFVTSPGRRVHEVVSQFGRFQRQHADDAFELSSWWPQDQGVDELTGWSVRTDRATTEPPVSAHELAVLRELDPEGHYR